MAADGDEGADPALVFLDPEDRPGTHVLLIGVGDYPWLEDGAEYDPEEHEDGAMGMAQLGAPPISVRAMADWFLGSFDHPDRPLSSLAMLVSDKQPVEYSHARIGKDAVKLPRGMISEVQEAVKAWSRRASGHRENSLVFAFCGHGLQAGNPVLLCRDYNRDSESRFEGAIDFEEFRIALSTRQPDTQLILVDACRIPDLDDAQLGQATPGNPLIGLQSLGKRDGSPAIQSVQFATSLYTEAWGRDDEPSLFTQAVVKALDGGAAEMTAGWWVTTSRLHTVLTTYLARASAEAGVVQRPAAGQAQDFPVCKPGPIAVDVYVTSGTEPEVWREAWRLRARSGTADLEFPYQPPALPDPQFREWRLQLRNATQDVRDVVYDVQATFAPGSPFRSCGASIIAYPPEVSCALPVSRQP